MSPCFKYQRATVTGKWAERGSERLASLQDKCVWKQIPLGPGPLGPSPACAEVPQPSAKCPSERAPPAPSSEATQLLDRESGKADPHVFCCFPQNFSCLLPVFPLVALRGPRYSSVKSQTRPSPASFWGCLFRSDPCRGARLV